MAVCAYCRERDGRTTDHLIKKNQVRRIPRLGETRRSPAFIVACCWECNVAIGTRCFVPPSLEYMIPELKKLTFNTYGVYDGKPETLRQELAK